MMIVKTDEQRQFDAFVREIKLDMKNNPEFYVESNPGIIKFNNENESSLLIDSQARQMTYGSKHKDIKQLSTTHMTSEEFQKALRHTKQFFNVEKQYAKIEAGLDNLEKMKVSKPKKQTKIRR